ncbi:hypothetical protein FA15DRAFT_717190 [Coprinopsis marcescibilis]|uniref:Ricin B lectin domain-containing protein n=1 Tax=Coprinopsis marcescibilis TaxID=230819 RepID=A0A5C3KMS9_COPMA|nr:hypothetical protein FA15DRAFT_717190 [Coprinopsis marcescibilis]
MSDSARYYRLTNDFNGPAWALDVLPDSPNNQLQIARAGDFSGQYWRLTPFPGQAGKFRLTTLFRGDDMALDIINDGRNDTPHLARAGNFSGQIWTLHKVDSANVIYKLSNDFTGTDKFLDVFPDQMKPRIAGGNPSGTHWTLTLIKI